LVLLYAESSDETLHRRIVKVELVAELDPFIGQVVDDGVENIGRVGIHVPTVHILERFDGAFSWAHCCSLSDTRLRLRVTYDTG
jgi:hypothetical protein